MVVSLSLSLSLVFILEQHINQISVGTLGTVQPLGRSPSQQRRQKHQMGPWILTVRAVQIFPAKSKNIKRISKCAPSFPWVTSHPALPTSALRVYSQWTLDFYRDEVALFRRRFQRLRDDRCGCMEKRDTDKLISDCGDPSTSARHGHIDSSGRHSSMINLICVLHDDDDGWWRAVVAVG